MNNNKYPTPYEIEEVCNNFLKRGFINSFMQGKGIFFINARQEDLAKGLAPILLGKEEVDTLRWKPQYDLESMTVDMLEKLRAKLNK